MGCPALKCWKMEDKTQPAKAKAEKKNLVRFLNDSNPLKENEWSSKVGEKGDEACWGLNGRRKESVCDKKDDTTSEEEK